MGLIYEVELPPVGASDVVERELSVVVNGVSSTYSLGANDKTFALPPVNEGVNISVSVRDKDDAGNWSDWSDPYTFDTKDTIKPTMPGPVTVNLLEEVADAVVEPATEPVVEPVVEPVAEPAVEPVVEPTAESPPTDPPTEVVVDQPVQ